MTEHNEGDRIYCFMMGAVVRAVANGHCPECGKWGSTHRRYEGDCGHWTECPVEPYGAHGHHCVMLEGHDGPHVAPCEVDPTPAPRST
jgi:hypothetical protein